MGDLWFLRDMYWVSTQINFGVKNFDIPIGISRGYRIWVNNNNELTNELVSKNDERLRSIHHTVCFSHHTYPT